MVKVKGLKRWERRARQRIQDLAEMTREAFSDFSVDTSWKLSMFVRTPQGDIHVGLPTSLFGRRIKLRVDSKECIPHAVNLGGLYEEKRQGSVYVEKTYE